MSEGRMRDADSGSTAPDADWIFLLGEDGRLERVPYTAYASEDILQGLLARYPELVVGEQIDPDDPPRWLLVRREAGIPDADQSSDRWSLDHLLLDQRAVPTLVEVKRSADTRIRREVIGQMLDYAANATRYWPTDRIRTLAAEEAGGVDQLDERIRELLRHEGGVEEIEAFWTRVEENLRSGTLRLLFVADELPRDLRRVIEFLNDHMPRVEVLGVEVRQYAGGGMRALVPRVIGQTERAREQKGSTGPTKKTDEAAFLEACPTWAHDFFRDLLSTARSRGLVISWGSKGFSVGARRADGRPARLLFGYPPGAVGIGSPFLEIYLKETDPADNPETLRTELRAIGAFTEHGRHTVRLVLAEPERLSSARAALPHLWALYDRISIEANA